MTDNLEELAEMTWNNNNNNKCSNTTLKEGYRKIDPCQRASRKVSVSIATATDGVEQYECETLENKVKDIEHKQQKLVTESSKQDVQFKEKLSKLKAQLEMYETILEVGIEDLGNGKLRGPIRVEGVDLTGH
nr:hypothetical transcript [Hymenolepis microstoma]